MWTLVPETSNDFSDNSNRYNQERISLVAFEQLVELNRLGIFCQQMIEQNEDSFLRDLFVELLSRGIVQQNVYGKSNSSGLRDYDMMIHLIQTFFLEIKKKKNSQDEYDNIVATLNYTDKVLPSVITGLIIGQDFETLCALTSFRIHLGE